ncbi:MAG: hypothetical protein DME99_02390 [Verrucomicrobia bacterium]|nr:MAG: hypothetical protein DME99_02390 [Verrucomicrobiota bacterium]
MGTVSESGVNRVARATLRTIFRSRCGFRPRRPLVDLRFVAAKVIRRLRRFTRIWERQFNSQPRIIPIRVIRVIRG